MNCFCAKTATGDADITPASPVDTRTAERISALGARRSAIDSGTELLSRRDADDGR